MHPHPPGGLHPPRFAPFAESSGALLRLVDTSEPAWTELAGVVCRDPALCFTLLAAAPLTAGEDAKLAEAVARRLASLGADLLRGWLLRLGWDTPLQDACSRRLSQRALAVAEHARHLALETRQGQPDEAYLAGLWYHLGEIWLQQAAPRPATTAPGSTDPGSTAPTTQAATSPVDHAVLSARLARECGFAPPVVDALELQSALEEQVAVAHPLAAILWAARVLASDDWQAQVDRCAHLTGLATGTLWSLRTDVTHLIKSETAVLAGIDTMPLPVAATRSPADSALRSAAISALIRGAFTGLERRAAGERLTLGCPLLFGRRAPLVAVAGDDDVLRPLPLAADDRHERWFADCRLRVDDPTSVVALAARSNRPSFHFTGQAGQAGPGRSPHDWHLARWLGGCGIACLPLPQVAGIAVAVFAADTQGQVSTGERPLLTELVGAAASSVLASTRQQAELNALSERLEARYRDHAHRLAHEAGNPISVIRNYLEAMARRQGEGSPLSQEIPLVDAELDRIAGLLQRLGELPADVAEAPRCDADEVLDEMQRLYGETLFAARGIRFEVRANGVPARVAMPASALKQVLVNLFRNAAEALQPGHRLVVALAGQLWVNGKPCVEIRLIDNGPGLPPERQADPFTAQPSPKGGDHRGLGLSVVRDLLGRWQATILCRSQAGSGTSFQIFIPLDSSG